MAKKQAQLKQTVSFNKSFTDEWLNTSALMNILPRFGTSLVVGLFIFIAVSKYMDFVLGLILGCIFFAAFLFPDKLKPNLKHGKKGKGVSYSPARLVALTVLGAAIFIILFWFVKIIPLITIPLIMVLALRLLTPNLDQWWSAGINAAAAFMGFLGAAQIYRLANFEQFFSHWAETNVDVIPSFFANTARNLPFSIINIDSSNAMMLALVAAFLAGALVIILGQAETMWPQLKQVLPHLLLAVIVVVFLFGATSEYADFATKIGIEPRDEGYGYDGYINLKTYYLMTHGDDYYNAYIKAALADSRLDEKNITGGWLRGPGTWRWPTYFYIWKIFSGGNGTNIFYISLFISIAALVMVFYGMQKVAGSALASLSIILVAPYLYLGTGWENIFLPDWWAALFALISIGLFLRKNYFPSVAFAFLAAVSREHALILLGIGMLAGLFARERKIWIPFGVSIPIVIGLYWAHLQAAKSVYIHYGKAASTSIVGLVQSFYTGFHTQSLVLGTHYVSWPISFLGLNIVVLFAGIIAALYLKDRVHRIFVTGYLVLYTLYLLFMLVSSYTGGMYMPLAMASLPLLLLPYLQNTEEAKA